MLNETTRRLDISNGSPIAVTPEPSAPRFKVYNERHLDQIPQLQRLSDEQRFNMQVVASVLPFRINPYVIENLIDWDNVPDDPMFHPVDFSAAWHVAAGRL